MQKTEFVLEMYMRYRSSSISQRDAIKMAEDDAQFLAKSFCDMTWDKPPSVTLLRLDGQKILCTNCKSESVRKLANEYILCLSCDTPFLDKEIKKK